MKNPLGIGSKSAVRRAAKPGVKKRSKGVNKVGPMRAALFPRHRHGSGKAVAVATSNVKIKRLLVEAVGTGVGTKAAGQSLLPSIGVALFEAAFKLAYSLWEKGCLVDDRERSILFVLGENRAGMTIGEIDGALLRLARPSTIEEITQRLRRLSAFPRKKGPPEKLVEYAPDTDRWFSLC